MAEKRLRQHSLILYKQRPGHVTHLGKKKLEIEVEGGERLSVRPKDVTVLHPGPIHSLAELSPQTGEIKTAWELLAGNTTDLAELAELAYGHYTPATAWAAWQQVDDGLYFSGSPQEVVAHSPETVAEERDSRQAKAAEERAWAAFLERVEAGQFAPEDALYLEDVQALALAERDQSRVLRALGRSESPENAHTLLLDLGYWDATVNPYPSRIGVSSQAPDASLPPLPDEPRRDLTHLTALAIDDEGSRDPDDALSWEDGRLWVHVADVAALVPPGSAADLEARARGANLYLPEGTVPMLPPPATQKLALGLAEVSPALSFAIDVGPEGEILALVEVVPSWVRVTRLTYREAETQLEKSPLQELHKLAQRYRRRRQQNGAVFIDLPEVKVRVEDGRVVVHPLHPLRSRELVQEAMLMTGAAVARFALEHDVPVPFTVQEGWPSLEDEMAASEEAGPSPAQMFALRRSLKRSQPQSTPGPHTGLGMERYTQSTSPLRRYLDLVVHQQLRAYLRGQDVLDGQAVMERVGAAEAVRGSVRRAERLSIAHWTLVYLQQHPDWQGEGVIVDKRGARDVVLIPELDLETQVYQQQDLPLDSRVWLRLNEVNLPLLEAHFRVS